MLKLVQSFQLNREVMRLSVFMSGCGRVAGSGYLHTRILVLYHIIALLYKCFSQRVLPEACCALQSARWLWYICTGQWRIRWSWNGGLVAGLSIILLGFHRLKCIKFCTKCIQDHCHQLIDQGISVIIWKKKKREFWCFTST